MPRTIARYLGLILLGVALSMGVPASAAAPDAPAQAKPLPTQVSKEGQVTVQVTPLMPSAARGAWRFEILFDPHVPPLDQDLLAAGVLVDAGGKQYRPLAWEGDPPGGHHRKGVLVFGSIDPPPRSVTLKLRRIGSVPERSFTWTLPAP